MVNVGDIADAGASNMVAWELSAISPVWWGGRGEGEMGHIRV